jgi:hypothetical protein
MDAREMKRPGRSAFAGYAMTVVWVVFAGVPPAVAQTRDRAFTGRVSVHLNTAKRDVTGFGSRLDTELWTGIEFHTTDLDENGAEYGVDLRHSWFTDAARPARLSVYDGFVGVRFGATPRVRLRGGHMWLPELGSVGALAGGLGEVGLGDADGMRIRAGVFSGAEPLLYEAGYVPGVRKLGGYVAFERGFLQKHLVGYTRVQQGPLLERSVLSVMNYLPIRTAAFVYQAAEFDVQGPANGNAGPGLSYFLTNARLTPHSRVELLGTYNRGRSIDARRLTEDVRSGRALTPQAIDGLRYESVGGRVTVEVVRQFRVYGGYWRDRNNRDDAATARIMLGGHAGNAFGSGFDISASDSWIDRAAGPYHSRFISVGRSLGRAIYLSVDYATSLAIVRFVRSDGIVIETRPSTRRLAATGSANLGRAWGLLFTVDHSGDDSVREVRVLTGLSYRLR